MRNGSKPLKKTSAIGIFDSGIGGLTVVRELLRILPNEPVVYLGDTARVPYGNKSRETVLKFSTENVLFLLQHDVKLIVIACHTSSSFALPSLERYFKYPILGVIEPGVEMALQSTRLGRIGVIGTNATVGSQAYPHAVAAAIGRRTTNPSWRVAAAIGRRTTNPSWRVARREPKVKLFQVPCPLFVPLVEEGCLNDPVAEQIAARYLKPLKAARIDTLILGCTHYPLLKGIIGKVMGSKVRLIDSAHQVVLKAKEILGTLDLLHSPPDRASPVRRFFVTDEPKHFEKLSVRFLGRRVGDVQRI